MRIILDTDNEQNFVDLWNPEKNNWERYIKCEEKKETKPITEESIEALGYACGEIQKCFTNGWEKSLKNKSLNQEDKKIEKLPIGLKQTMKNGIHNTIVKNNIQYELNEKEEIICYKINEIIDYIMEDK